MSRISAWPLSPYIVINALSLPGCIKELRLLETRRTMLAPGVGVVGRGLCRYRGRGGGGQIILGRYKKRSDCLNLKLSTPGLQGLSHSFVHTRIPTFSFSSGKNCGFQGGEGRLGREGTEAREKGVKAGGAGKSGHFCPEQCPSNRKTEARPPTCVALLDPQPPFSLGKAPAHCARPSIPSFLTPSTPGKNALRCEAPHFCT